MKEILLIVIVFGAGAIFGMALSVLRSRPPLSQEWRKIAADANRQLDEAKEIRDVSAAHQAEALRLLNEAIAARKGLQ